MSESTLIIDEVGTKIWRNVIGQLHRLDGPAYEGFDGEKLWCQNGEYHRLDGPAIESSHNIKYWYQNGKRHRLDGPAIEWSNGTSSWYYYDDWLGNDCEGFWTLWDYLDDEERQNVNLHIWLLKLTKH